MAIDNISNLDRTYCLKVGGETIYRLSSQQLQKLHNTITDFFDRENEIPLASEDLSPELGQYTKIEKMICFDNEVFETSYNVSAGGEILQYIKAWQLLDLFLVLHSFLRQVEGIDIDCFMREMKNDKIKTKSKKKKKHLVRLLEETAEQKKISVILDDPYMSKDETLEKMNITPNIEYGIYANDLCLDGLSYAQVKEIQYVIAQYL